MCFFKSDTQPAVKVVMNICSIQISYSGVVFVLIHCTPFVFSLMLVKLSIHPYTTFQLNVSAYWFKTGLYLIKHAVTKFSVISSIQQTLAFIASFFLTECFPKVGTFMRIIWYYVIIRSGKKWSGKWRMGWWIRLPEQRQKNIIITKK